MLSTTASSSASGGFERTTFDDEAERKRDLMRVRAQRADETAMVMARAMREGEGLVQDMREQEAAKQQMRAAYQTGHVDKARGMAEKLDPKYVSPEELKKMFGGPAPLNSKKPGGHGERPLIQATRAARTTKPSVPRVKEVSSARRPEFRLHASFATFEVRRLLTLLSVCPMRWKI